MGGHCADIPVSRHAWAVLLAAVAAGGGSGEVQARPERIKPDISYYADECEESGGVFDLVGERNLEEVYQNYSYCEVIYDGQGRVKTYRQYRRGKAILTEHYIYDSSGRLRTRQSIVNSD